MSNTGPTKKPGVNRRAHKGEVVPASYKTTAVCGNINSMKVSQVNHKIKSIYQTTERPTNILFLSCNPS
jgi:hypothetical protein